MISLAWSDDAAHVARFDGKLAPAAIDQHQQLHAGGPSLIDSASSAARTVRPV